MNMKKTPDAATLRQIEAADPGNSTWLSANAGSGKTRVLTDRVARLLLNDVSPQGILCLTYTKAAASEMQNRLFKRLGEWAMLEDTKLIEALDGLGVDGPLDANVLAKARRLFARAIETPGGLKIQTIHSFCAALLRRFPLEAGLSPGFTEMDEHTTAELQSSVLDDLSVSHPYEFGQMAALVSDSDMNGLCGEISKHRAAFPDHPAWEDCLALYQLGPGCAEADILASVIPAGTGPGLTQACDVLRGGTKTMVALADDIALALREGVTSATFGVLAKRCLYASGDADRIGTPKTNLVTAKMRDTLGALASDIDELAGRLADARDRLNALKAARHTFALHQFAALFLPKYEKRKAARGWLDFDDLIEKTEHLLRQPGVADWVLYRLDGNIDHVLVDEAQDTSPRQWKVIEHLTREFTSGEGAGGDRIRTIFVVGDLKQSIYSFQGADPDSFNRMQNAFAQRLSHIETHLNTLELEHSFRSAEPILRSVDTTFGPENTRGMGGAAKHRAFQSELPGRVDLWPLIEPVEKPEKTQWFDPVDQISDQHHTVQLAQQIGQTIRKMIAENHLWEPTKPSGYQPRRMHEGDFLILVQSRGPLFHEIIRACKVQNLRVAGADVLKLGEELAVKDILALLSFLATPEDSLSLAAVLRSPLFGWSEAQLFDLAAKRTRPFLWQELRERRDEFAEDTTVLSALLDDADFLRPYDLIDKILLHHDGRRKLVARLGEEASDGIDALLLEALAFEQEDPGGLTGFLARMQQSSVDVKRRAEGRSDKIRVMTVHGAKGLEAPIVILPDTVQKPKIRQYSDDIFANGDAAALWASTGADAPRVAKTLKAEAVDKRLEEAQRLLYVAMTRAEQWLIVAGAGKLGSHGDSWFEQIQRGLGDAGAQDHDFGFGPGGLRLSTGPWNNSPLPPQETDSQASQTKTPSWANLVAPVPERPMQTLAPSDLGGAKVLAGPGAGLNEEEAKRYGRQIHLLLEHLPEHPRKDWSDMAGRILSFGPDAAKLEDVLTLLREAEQVLTAPQLLDVFGPGALAEVDISASCASLGDARIHGTVDRLIVGQNDVLAIDFKSNRIVPTTAENVPIGLLRQMGAYAEGLEAIYPGKTIRTALLWTKTAELMELPHGLIRHALTATPIP